MPDTTSLNAADVELVDRETLFDGYVRLYRYRLRHRLAAGGWTRPIDREVLDRGDAAAVLPYDPRLDRIVMVEQFRPGAYGAGFPPWQVEPVGGMIDEGDDPLATIRREAMEEAGIRLGRYEKAHEFLPSSAGMQSVVTLYCAEADASVAGGIHGEAAEDEETRVVILSPEEALGLVSERRSAAAGCLIALQWLLLNRDRLREIWGD